MDLTAGCTAGSTAAGQHWMNVRIYADYFILGPASRGEEKQPCHHRRIRKSGPSLRREDEAVTPDVQLLPPRIRRWELWMERYVSILLTLSLQLTAPSYRLLLLRMLNQALVNRKTPTRASPPRIPKRNDLCTRHHGCVYGC